MDNNQLQDLVSIVQKDGVTDYYGNQWHIYYTIPELFLVTILIFCLLFEKAFDRLLIYSLGLLMLIITIITTSVVLSNRSKYYNKMTNPENYIYRLVTLDRN